MKNLPYFNDFISDSSISESLYSSWGSKIFEIGRFDQAQEPLDWERLGGESNDSVTYRFYLGPSSEYTVELNKTLWSYPKNVNVEFYANGDRDNVTNEGHPLLVMVTVISIIKDFLQKDSSVESFSFVPSMADQEDRRRLNLYLRYIQGHFNDPKIDKEELPMGKVAITVYL